MKSWVAPVFGASLAGLAGCHDTLTLPWGAGGPRIPVPAGFPEAPWGTGRDGALHLAAGEAVAPSVCVPVASASGVSIALATTAGNPFVAGEGILVHQVQDTFAVVADSSLMFAPARAGRWELARIGAADSGGEITLVAALEEDYQTAPGASAQACNVREFASVSLDAGARIVPSHAWNGASGGVIAFFVSGDLALAEGAAIDASEGGFRGAPRSTAPNNTGSNVILEVTTPDVGAPKGEGLDPGGVGLHGRGNVSSGAGGGNAFNAGGGGGGSVGAGGFGGDQYSNTGTNYATRGRGGQGLAITDGSRMFFGGGGGAGHADDGRGVPGAPGGGALLLGARRVVGAGALRANGGAATASRGTSGATGDAGSGGGGGGWIFLPAQELAGFFGAIEARGGDGGNTAILVGGDDSWGPGGGGGGGLVVLGAPWSGSPAVAPGAPGLTEGGPFGATAGAPGTVVMPAP